MDSRKDGARRALTRRDLLVKYSAGGMVMGLMGACAPVLPMTTLPATQSGDPAMKMVAIEPTAVNETTAPTEASFYTFLRRFEEGTTRFVNGDASLWIENASHGDEATIMGAWGAYEQGWEEVGSRYEWAAARFVESGAKVEFEYLATGVSGELAYTVANERSEALVVGQEKAAAMALRATHLFRLEDGAWKLVHRHADPLMEKTAAATVLQK